MECNKDEALRAKQIAETRMQSNDFDGALRFAQKAQRLFPQLENMAQTLAVCEVHCAAQKKLGSEADWYAVLQIETSADEITIKKQYRKLALLLHPDKNKFSGSEAAFKLIGEANSILIDKDKRSLYDLKRKSSVTVANQKPPAQKESFSKQCRANVKPGNASSSRNPDYSEPKAHQSTQKEASTQKESFSKQCRANFKPGNASSSRNPDYSEPPAHQSTQKESFGKQCRANVKPGNASKPQQAEDKSFWTICPLCKVMYRYSSLFLHKTLVCQNCKKSFIAFKLDASGKTARFEKASTPQKDVPNVGSSKDRNHPSKSKCEDTSSGGRAKVNVQTKPESKARGIPKTDPNGNHYQQAEDKAFQTMCPSCKVRQHASLFLHHCENCKKPFLALKLDVFRKTDDQVRNSKSKTDTGGDSGANAKVNIRGIPKTDPTKVKPQDKDDTKRGRRSFPTASDLKPCSSHNASTHQKVVPNGGSLKDNHGRNHISKLRTGTGSNGGGKVQNADVKVHMHAKPENKGCGVPKTDPMKVKPQEKGDTNTGIKKRVRNSTTDCVSKRRRTAN